MIVNTPAIPVDVIQTTEVSMPFDKTEVAISVDKTEVALSVDKTEETTEVVMPAEKLIKVKLVRLHCLL